MEISECSETSGGTLEDFKEHSSIAKAERESDTGRVGYQRAHTVTQDKETDPRDVL